jgi:PAS domain S-box-containing protein
MGTRDKAGKGKHPDLRKWAEAVLKERGEEDPKDLSPEEVRDLLHELHTYQIELEIQNEELRQAQQELLASRDRFLDLYDFSPVGHMTLNEKGLIVEANLTLAEMLGKERSLLIRQPFSAFILPEDQDTYYHHRRRHSETRKNQRYELRLLREGSEPFWARIDCMPVPGDEGGERLFRATVSDDTERKRAEEQVGRFRDLIDQAGEAIFLVDPATGTFLHVNEAAAARLGYTIAEMLEMGVLDIDAELPTPEMWAEHVKDVVERGSVLFEGVHKHRDGTTFPVEVSVSHLARGGRDYIIAVARDISERKQAEREKAGLEAQLRQAQKMEAIGTLSGGIAHDFNNVLAIILGNTELAVSDMPEWNPARANLEEIMKACLRAKDMVRQILAFSRQAAPERKQVPIGTLIRETLKLMRATIPTTVEIRQDLGEDQGTVLADASQVSQIVLNLCANAAHAMRERGGVLKVTLRRRVLDTEAPSLHPELKPGEWWVMHVSDTGHGMTPELLSRVFDPYFTTKGAGEGSGMGLSVVHGIVHNCGGVVLARSEPRRGSEFEVFLPCHAPSDEPEDELPALLPTGKERVLLVDDEEAIATMAKKMLEHLGYQVTETTSSLKALELFRDAPGQFDLAITDMTMPEMNGTDLSLELLRIRSDIPVILCTGFSELISEVRARKLGIRAFLTKPMTMRLLAETVRQVLDS